MLSTNLFYIATLLSPIYIESLKLNQEVCITGYVMDKFCINRGTLLDNPSVTTLEEPDKHSYHCLLDVPFCIESGYEILVDPAMGETTYARGVSLDVTGNQLVLDVGRAHGASGTCTTCTEDKNSNSFGFRATAIGTLSSMGDSTSPPTLAVVEFGASVDLSCPDGVTNMADVMDETPMMQAEDVVMDETAGTEDIIGKEVCITGYVVDNFCLERGTFLDAPDVKALEFPDQHSYHCLLDVPQCVESGYEVLLDPEGQGLYSQGIRLNDSGNQLVLDVARAQGNPTPCTTCSGTAGSEEKGFRATVIGTISDLGSADTPPTVDVTDLDSAMMMDCPVNVASIADLAKNFPINLGEEEPEETADTEGDLVGKEVCIEGYVVDLFCLNRGTFLDAPDVKALEFPDQHSYHCLLDVPQCIESGYEILLDREGQDLYSRGIRLDDAGNQLVLDVGRAQGNTTSCTTCTGETGNSEKGFRAVAVGTISDLGNADTPPTVDVTELTSAATTSCPANVAAIADLAESFPINQPAEEDLIGKEVCIEGYVVDLFCINRGTFLDAPDVKALEFPDQHSYHCLLDVPQCIESGYEVLLDPEGEELYTRGIRLDDSGNQMALEVARAQGNPTPCTTCSGEAGNEEKGFRAVVIGTISDLGNSATPPTVGVTKLGSALTTSCPANVAAISDLAKNFPINSDQATADSKCEGKSDNPDYDKMLSLQGDNEVAFYYSIVDDTYLSAQIVYQGIGWIAWGVSPAGGMIGAEAVIGLPDEANSATNPGKYALSQYSPAGVNLVDAQTLKDATIVQENGVTTLTFMKLLQEDGEHIIDPNGVNKFIYAVGSSGNDLAYHGSSRSPFEIDFSQACGGTEETAETTEVDPAEELVGQDVCITGYVVDLFCLNRGTFLDAPDVKALEFPDQHSYHCLLDVPQCIESGYEVLLDPTGDEMLYSRGIRLTDDGNQLALEVARGQGNPEPCTTCTGTTGNEEKGFRATVVGTITDIGSSTIPPTVDVAELGSASDLVCPDNVKTIAELARSFPINFEEDTTAESDSDCEGQSDNPDYDRMVALQPNNDLVFYYSVLGDALSAQIVYQGTGWVGFGVSPSGQMVGGEVVIGLPDDANSATNPGKYLLSQRSQAGVNLAASQTLQNATIVQENGVTSLTFTKLLLEPGEVAIDPNGVNTFIWAVGSSNPLAYHASRGPFDLDLSQSCGAPPSLIAAPQAVPISYWKAHGALAGISWGLLTPLAVSASIHRDFFNGGMWFKVHQGLNGLTVLCTIAAFAIAVVAYAKSGIEQFSGKHQRLGLVMTIIVVIHSVGAIFRPHIAQDVEKSRNRRLWEVAHRLMGYFLFFASIWQIQEGLALYAQRSGKNFTMVYWVWLIIYAVVNLLLFGYVQLKKRRSASA